MGDQPSALPAVELLDSLPDAVLLVDALARLRWCNRVARDWLACGPAAAALPASGGDGPSLADWGLAASVLSDLDGGHLVADIGPAGAARQRCRISVGAAVGGMRLLLLRPVPAQAAPSALAGAPTQQAQEWLRRFELVARGADIGYWTMAHGAERTQWSAHLARMHGLPDDTPAPPPDEWFNRFVHPDDRQRVQDSLEQWRASGQPYQMLEYRIVRTDAAVMHIVLHAHREGDPDRASIFGIVINVTRQRRDEQALRQSAARERLVADGVGLATWEFDSATRRLFWDAQMWRLRGRLPRDEPPSEADVLAGVHADDLALVRRCLLAGRAEGDSAVSCDDQFRVRWPDGGWHWLAVRSAPVNDAQGRPQRHIGVCWDVTDLHRAAAERREREDAQREARAKAQFLARMSHELRTPLNAVLGFTDLLLMDDAAVGRDAPLRVQRLQHVRQAGTHLLRLVDDLLDLSRTQGSEVRVEPQAVALDEVLDAVLTLTALQAGVKQVRLAVAPLPRRMVWADPQRLRQVLLHLLHHATARSLAGAAVDIHAEDRPGRVGLWIADAGPALTAVQCGHLFEPSPDSAGDGGMGMVKTLVERMGGAVHAEPGAGGGLCCAVWFPVAPDDVGRVGTADAAASGCVLYVEDNPINVLIVSELIARRPDIRLHTVDDGESALAQVATLRPDLILLDMQLPGISGLEVFRRLRADPQAAAIPCIALSANAMPSDIERARALGFADYWTKPLDFRCFYAALDQFFGSVSEPGAGHPG